MECTPETWPVWVAAIIFALCWGVNYLTTRAAEKMNRISKYIGEQIEAFEKQHGKGSAERLFR